jgi:hypothetical protein
MANVELIKLTKDYTPHPVKYFDLINCNSGGTDFHTTSDLNYNIYAYVGRYVNIFTGSTTAFTSVGCFEVVEGQPNPNYDYEQIMIGSGYTPSGVNVYSDCGCSGRTQFELVQQNYPEPTEEPSPSPTPTPSVTPAAVTPTPTNTPSLTPTNTPSLTPTNTPTGTISVTPTPTNTPTQSSFDPSQLPGIYLWYRADTTIIINGGEVTSWTDIINSKVASSGGTKAFTYNASDAAFNNEPTIEFNKDFIDSAYLTASNIVFNGNDYFYWCVYLMNTPQNSEQIYSEFNVSGVQTIHFNGGGSGNKKEYLPFGVNVSRMISPYTTNLNVAQIFIGEIDNSALTYQLWDNRTTPTTGGTMTASISSGTGTFYIGNGLSYNANQYQMDGRIAEMGYCWTKPSPTELTNLFNYLTTRYGVTLS